MTTLQQTLYRFYSDTGQLLYVGRTINPGQRFTDHARTKTWWPDVRGITTETYPDATQLAAAERRAIDIERPLYNIQRPALRPTSAAAPTRDLVWICDTCTKPVADFTGYLHVSLLEVHQAEQAHRAFEERTSNIPVLPVSEYLELPTVHWVTHHRDCDPDIESADYCIQVDRLRTHADLLARTAHLSEKRWLEVTDWFDLIRRLADVRP